MLKTLVLTFQVVQGNLFGRHQGTQRQAAGIINDVKRLIPKGPLPVLFVPGISGTGLLTKISDNESDADCRLGVDAEADVGVFTGTYNETNLKVQPSNGGSWYRTWLSWDIWRPTAFHQKCWFQLMSLIYEPPTSMYSWSTLGRWVPPVGVEVSVDPGLHGVDYLDYIAGYGIGPTRYFHDLIQAVARDVGTLTGTKASNFGDTMTLRGAVAGNRAVDYSDDLPEPIQTASILADPFVGSAYVRDVNMTSFGYDWRLPVWQIDWKEFARRVESTYEASGDRPVILISHSMGSLWLNYFFHTFATQEWKAKYIRAVISINGANGGSFKALRALVSGYSPLNSTWLNYFNIPQLIPMTLIRDLGRSFPAVYSLLPQEQIYGMDTVALTLAGATPDEPRKLFTLRNWTQVISDPEVVHAIELVKTTLGDVGLQDPGVNYYCFFSISEALETEFRFHYSEIDSPPEIEMTWGDGTLPAPSLAYCRNWPSTKMVKVFPNLDHMFALRDPQVAKLVTEVIIDLSAVNE